MDIYDYLKMDHDKVSMLFKQFEKSTIPERKKEIADFIIFELLLHAKSEEATFYKALEKFKKSEEEALHGEHEHKEIEAQIALIQSSKATGSAFNDKIEKLQELVKHHVKEEEGPLFRDAKKVLSQTDAYAIKEQMHALKGKLLENNEIN